MASLTIDDPRAVELAQKLAGLTGESVTQAVVRSLEERLGHYCSREVDLKLFDDLVKITEPPIAVVDHRSDAEILGYNEFGGS